MSWFYTFIQSFFGLQILKHKISLLEQSKVELQEELLECRTGYEHLTQRAIEAQVERDRLLLKIESIQNGKPFDEIDSNEKVLIHSIGFIFRQPSNLHFCISERKHFWCPTGFGYIERLYHKNSRSGDRITTATEFK